MASNWPTPSSPASFITDRAGAASEKMIVAEWMERMGATAIGAHPARHRREGEVGDPHRLLLMSFRKNFLALSRREHVEQFCRGHDVNVQAETGVVDQRQRLVHERIRHARALQHNCALRIDRAPNAGDKRLARRMRPEASRALRDRAPFPPGRVTNGAMIAGRLASAAETRNQISCGSHGVSVIMVPSGKFSCSSCSGCGSAWVGPSSPVFNPAWAQMRKNGR